MDYSITYAMPHRPTRPVEKLTTRQRQVFDLIVLGLSNKEIGQILGLSPNTVKIHIGKLFDKLGVRHRSGVALAGAKLGISQAPGDQGLLSQEMDRSSRLIMIK